MVRTRAAKVAHIAKDIPLLEVEGPSTGDVLVLSWGGTYGACTQASQQARSQGLKVASAHLRHLNPFPRNLEEVLRSYKKVLVPELNLGQLRTLLRARYLVDAVGLNKIQGKPFKVAEIVKAVEALLGE
jgi:2-oxoglutarate ferredoxin oxidoreductase subunit alpha